METDTFFHFAVEWKHVIHILQQQDFSDVTLGLGRKTKFAKIHNYQKLTLFNGPCFVMDKKKKNKGLLDVSFHRFILRLHTEHRGVVREHDNNGLISDLFHLKQYKRPAAVEGDGITSMTKSCYHSHS